MSRRRQLPSRQQLEAAITAHFLWNATHWSDFGVFAEDEHLMTQVAKEAVTAILWELDK